MKYKHLSDMGMMMEEEDKSFTHQKDYGMEADTPMSHEEHEVEGTTNNPLESGLVLRQPL